MRVLTGGTFDLLHYGHVLHLKTCAGIADGIDNVIVMLVSDRWAQERKGKLRTLVTWKERALMLKALGVIHIKYVDKPKDILNLLKSPFMPPDIYIYEYNSNQVAHDVALKYCKSNDITAINLGKHPENPFGTSTTSIIERIHAERNNRK